MMYLYAGVTYKFLLGEEVKANGTLGVNPCLFSGNDLGHTFPLTSKLEKARRGWY